MKTNRANQQPEILLSFYLGLDRLIDAMSGLRQDEVFKLFVEIDLLVADYDFTKKLADHFAAEIAKEDATK